MQEYHVVLGSVKVLASRAAQEQYKVADGIALIFRNYAESLEQFSVNGAATLSVYTDYLLLGPNLIDQISNDLNWMEEDVQSACWCGEARFNNPLLRQRQGFPYSVLSRVARHPSTTIQEEIVRGICGGMSIASIKRQLSEQATLRQFYVSDKICYRCSRQVLAPNGIEVKHIGSSERKFFCNTACHVLFNTS